MATKFEELVNDMINVSVGAAATAAEKGREVLEGFGAKGEEVRGDSAAPDFARSMSDAFQRAGVVFTDATARFSVHGEAAAERVLDELIVARLRTLDVPSRDAFASHVEDLVRMVNSEAVSVPVEAVVDEGESREGARSADASEGVSENGAATEESSE